MMATPSVIPAPEEGFLRPLFANLNSSGLYYAVMRNYEPLPDSLAGSDLDLIIHPGDEAAVRRVIYQTIQQAQGTAIGYAATLGFFKVFAFGRNPAHRLRWWGARIDVNIGYAFQGNATVDPAAFEVYQTVYNDIKVLEPGFAAVLGVLKEILNNSRMPERYRLAAQQAVREDWPRLSQALAPMGERGLMQFRQLLLADTIPANLFEIARALRQSTARHACRLAPWPFIRNRWRHEWAKVVRYWRPPGVMIAVLGTDGVGKSTVINAIKPVLELATHGSLEVRHLRPGLLPPLARLKGQSKVSEGPVLDPHGSTPSGAFGSLFRLAYLTLDYVLGYWLVLRPKLARSPTVILFDRYCYDMALDPRRFRINLNTGVINWFIRWIPKPNILFCLYAEPEAILLRKQELTPDEVTRQVAALQVLANREPHALLISTACTIEETCDTILQGLVHHCLTNQPKS